MVSRETYNSVLDLGNVPGILLYLLDHESAVVTEIKNNVLATYNRLKDTMDALENEGLVNLDYTEAPRVTYRYSLTDRGRKIALLLKDADAIL